MTADATHSIPLARPRIDDISHYAVRAVDRDDKALEEILTLLDTTVTGRVLDRLGPIRHV